MEAKVFCIYNELAEYGHDIKLFTHQSVVPFPFTERKMPFESGAAAGPEQGIPFTSHELGNLYAPLRHTLSPADSAAGLLCHFPLLPHGICPAGIQKEQYPDPALAG